MGIGKKAGKLVGDFAKKQSNQFKEDSSPDDQFRYYEDSSGQLVDRFPDKPSAVSRGLGFDKIGTDNRLQKALKDKAKAGTPFLGKGRKGAK